MSPRKAPLTYASAGVRIEAGSELVRRITPLARRTRRPEVLSGLGGFGAAFRPPRGLRKPLFVVATDGVGTKLRLAFRLDRHDTVGIDLVAMNVNDVLTVGAEPLVFLDYFATGGLDVDRATAVVRGIARGCREAGCALVGGETAEMPSFYDPGEYDLAGFVVAAVDEKRRITGERIRPGHVLIGLASSGLHSNGFSLVRHILEKRRIPLSKRIPEFRRTVGEELLRPTRIYVRPVLELLRRVRIDGLAHVTGGGIVENLPRVLPRGTHARIERGSWPVPPVFDWLGRTGPVSREEMDRTFNQGLGMILVVRPRDADRVLRFLRQRRQRSWVIGEVVRGRPGVTFNGTKGKEAT